MKKYKINRSKDENIPSDEEIFKYKDFGSLKYNYDKITKPPKPLYKDPKAFLFLVVIIIIAWLLSSEYFQKNDDKKIEKTEIKTK